MRSSKLINNYKAVGGGRHDGSHRCPENLDKGTYTDLEEWTGRDFPVRTAVQSWIMVKYAERSINEDD